jgi:hypothetical protein
MPYVSPLSNRLLDEAEQHWLAGRFQDAGRILYENVPRERRVVWASSVLEHAYRYFEPVAEVDEVLVMARAPHRWHEAHEAFQRVRQVSLRMGHLPVQESILFLAETTCKVIYNASGQPAPFDFDAGWLIPQHLVHVINLLESSELAFQAWPLLTAPDSRGPILPRRGLSFVPTQEATST